MDDLAKCPWCKILPKVLVMPVNGAKHFYVKCMGRDKCPVHPSTFYSVDRKVVIEAWNRCQS